jgi:hypothetical protein
MGRQFINPLHKEYLKILGKIGSIEVESELVVSLLIFFSSTIYLLLVQQCSVKKKSWKNFWLLLCKNC